MDHAPIRTSSRIDARSDGPDQHYQRSYRSKTTVAASDRYEIDPSGLLMVYARLSDRRTDQKREREAPATLVVWDALQKLFADEALFRPLIAARPDDPDAPSSQRSDD